MLAPFFPKEESEFIQQIINGNSDNVQRCIENDLSLLNTPSVTGDKIPPLLIAAWFGKYQIALKLIELGALPYQVAQSSQAGVLEYAAFGGQLDFIVNYSKAYHVQLTQKRYYNRTLLHFAAFGGHPKLFLTLIDMGFKPNDLDADGQNALFYIRNNSFLKIFDALIKTHNLHPFLVNNQGNNLLHTYASDGLDEYARILVSKHKLNPNTPGKDGKHALQFLVESGHIDKLEQFIEITGLDPLKCARGLQPVFEIALNKYPFEKILKHSKALKLTQVCYKGGNILHAYLEKGFPEKVDALVDALKLDPTSKNYLGDTLLHVGLKRGIDPHFIFLWKEKYSLDPAQANNLGQNIIHLSILNQNLPLVYRFASQFKLDIDITDNKRRGVLFLAIMTGNLQMAFTLKKKFPKLDEYAQDNSNNSLMHYAVKYLKFKEMVSLQKTYSLPIEIKNKKGETPLEYLARHSNAVTFNSFIYTFGVTREQIENLETRLNQIKSIKIKNQVYTANALMRIFLDQSSPHIKFNELQALDSSLVDKVIQWPIFQGKNIIEIILSNEDVDSATLIAEVCPDNKAYRTLEENPKLKHLVYWVNARISPKEHLLKFYNTPESIASLLNKIKTNPYPYFRLDLELVIEGLKMGILEARSGDISIEAIVRSDKPLPNSIQYLKTLSSNIHKLLLSLQIMINPKNHNPQIYEYFEKAHDLQNVNLKLSSKTSPQFQFILRLLEKVEILENKIKSTPTNSKPKILHC